MKCEECKKEFKALRSTARFCSDTCKKRFARKSVPLTSVPLSPTENVPLKNTPKYPKGFCHNCGKPEPEAWKGLMCICLECINKGVTHTSLGLDKNAC